MPTAPNMDISQGSCRRGKERQLCAISKFQIQYFINIHSPIIFSHNLQCNADDLNKICTQYASM